MSFLLEFNENIYDPWCIEYIAYEPIYEGLYERCDQGHWTPQDEKDFESAIRLEAGKVDMFINRKQREIESRIGYCERNLFQQKNMSDATRNSIDDALTDILADINELGRFTRINFKALESLIEQHDNLTHTNRQPLLVEVCRTRPLDKQRFDTILVQVSSLLDICRNRLAEPTSTNATPTTSFDKQQSISARYWVHQDNVTEVKAMLLFNLPIYFNDPTQEFEQSDRPTSAVYFDNDHFTQYSSRLQGDDGAEMIKCKWYGDKASARLVTIERDRFIKTDHGGEYVHDEMKLDAHLVQDFISQRYSAEEYANDLTMKNDNDQNYVNQCYTTAHSIQKYIKEKRLEPKLRVFFNRLLFQSPQDRTLSVTLDSHVAFAREGNSKLCCWRRQDMDIAYPFTKLTPQQDVYLFPHAILETNIVGIEIPLWLSRLLDSKLVYEVPRFSNYLHGVAQFWSPQLPLLPWWLSEMDQDIRTAATTNEQNLTRSNSVKKNFSGLSRSKSLKPLIDGHYRMGYLESQLGKKQDRRHRHSRQGINSNDNKLVGGNDRENLGTTTDERNLWAPDDKSSSSSSGHQQKKEEKGDYLAEQVENVDSTHSLPLHRTSTSAAASVTSRTRLRSRASNRSSSRSHHNHKEDSSFIHTYLDGRNNQSQAYMLQDTDTVGQQDETRKAAIIEMGQEKEKEKKQKKKKPPSHTLEPKQFFANERTFIHWLQFSAIIMSAALVLLNFGDRVSTIAGATFFAVSLVICLYAFFRYRYRAYQMSTQPHIRYDDLYGPVGLCALLVGAMIVSYLDPWKIFSLLLYSFGLFY